MSQPDQPPPDQTMDYKKIYYAQYGDHIFINSCCGTETEDNITYTLCCCCFKGSLYPGFICGFHCRDHLLCKCIFCI